MALASFVVGAALRDLRRSGALAVLGALLSALAVVVTGVTVGGLEALGNLGAAWRSELRLVVLLRQAPAEPEAPGSAVGIVRALPGVAAARYIGPEAALAELRRYLGVGGPGRDGLAQLPANPVPARIEITPATTLTAARLRSLVGELGQIAGVEAVEADMDWVEPAERLARAVQRGGFGLSGTLALAAFLAVAGATSAARRAGADEIAVLRRSGVREVCIRGPLLLQAIVLGTGGAALGVGALVLASDAVLPHLTGGLPFVAPPPWPVGAGLIGAGLAWGLVGGLAGGRP